MNFEHAFFDELEKLAANKFDTYIRQAGERGNLGKLQHLARETITKRSLSSGTTDESKVLRHIHADNVNAKLAKQPTNTRLYADALVRARRAERRKFDDDSARFAAKSLRERLKDAKAKRTLNRVRANRGEKQTPWSSDTSPVDIAHDGGLSHIKKFMKGRGGYSTNGEKPGMWVHPVEVGEHRQRYYRERAAGKWFDTPASLSAKVPAHKLVKQDNAYEATIPTSRRRDLKNVKVKKHAFTGGLPALIKPELKIHERTPKDIKDGYADVINRAAR